MLIGVGLMGLMAGCTNSYYLKPITTLNDSTEVIYLKGAPVAISRGKETTVLLRGFKIPNGAVISLWSELALGVYVKNSSQKRMDVIPENIVVYGFGSQLQKKYLKVHTAEGYLRKVRRRQNWALAAQALSGAIEATEAAKSTSSTSGYVSGSGGTIYGHTTTETYDAGKESEATARNVAAAERTQQQNAQINAALEQGLLGRTTLFPGEHVAGTVMVRFKKCSGKLIIKVPVGNEVHTFIFSSTGTK